MNDAQDRLSRERDFHNARYADGDNRLAQGEYYVALTPCFERYHRRVHELARGAVVLEFGCGHGDNAISLAGEGLRIEGIDISETAI